MWTERIVKCAIGVAGVVSIIASGGVSLPIGFPPCENNCSPPGPIAIPQVAGVTITQRQTVQVGTPAVFKATPSTYGPSSLTYAWCRTPPGGGSCDTISGAVEATLTIASPDLTDDGARFTVTVSGTDKSNASASSQLLVSSMAGVVFADGDFADADWSTSANIQPPDLPSTYAVSRVADGGDPGAFRKVVHDVLESGNVKVFHERLSATYDPGSQGEIHAIDFTIDCLLITRSAQADTLLLISQGDRRYAAFVMFNTSASGSCGGDPPPLNARWYTAPRPSVLRENFQQVDGPACGVGEDCPDFSAHAAPLRFGMMTNAYVNGQRPPTPVNFHFEHGIDNWKVTVWRK